MRTVRRSSSREKTRARRRARHAPAAAPAATGARRALSATDGSDASSAAMRIARLMSSRGYWAPNVLTVLAPLPVSVGEVILPAPPVQYQLIVGDTVNAEIRRQLRQHGHSAWPITTEFGRPVPLIVQTAREGGCSLIVLGLGRHGRLGRLFGAETAARVIRHAGLPVLAVEARARALPRVALAAVDFSESSVRAAREAIDLIEPPGRMHLVHVKPRYNTTSFADAEWEQAYAAAAEHEFSRARDAIGSRAGIDVTSSLLTGDVIEVLLDEAKSRHAGLIAIGSHSEKILDRLMIGSTPAQILRAARCSVLVAPPEHVT